jgi:hypothetical protein
LLELEAPTALRSMRGQRDLWAATFGPGEHAEERRRFERSELGLFDVTDLVRLD